MTVTGYTKTGADAAIDQLTRSLHVVAVSGAAQTVDASVAVEHDVTLTANCTITLAGATAGKLTAITVWYRQDGTGARTLTHVGTVATLDGSALTIAAAANAITVVTYVSHDGGSSWLAWSSVADPTTVFTRTAVKTANYTAVAGDMVPVDTTGGAVTVTLPNAPVDKSRVLVKHIIQGGTNAVTVACAGADVFNKAGGGTSMTLPLLAQAITVQYDLATHIWTIQNDDLPLSALDARHAAIGRLITAGTGLTGGGDLSADRTLAVSFGTGTNQALRKADADSLYDATGLASAAQAAAQAAADLAVQRVLKLTPARLETFPRLGINGVPSGVSGTVQFVFVDAPWDATAAVSILRIVTNTTSPSGLTLCRIGRYTRDGSDNLTLEAFTADFHTSMAASTDFQQALASGSTLNGVTCPSSITWTRGAKYAFAYIFVGTTHPKILSLNATTLSAVTASTPTMGMSLASQADLPASATFASLAQTTTLPWMAAGA